MYSPSCPLLQVKTKQPIKQMINGRVSVPYFVHYVFCQDFCFEFFGAYTAEFQSGGLVIAVIGFRMLVPSPAALQGSQISGSIAFVPLTIPCLCGPGTEWAVQIAALPPDTPRMPLWAGMIAAFAALSAISWGVLKMAAPVCRFMGESGIDALTRFMEFLLICMGMQFGITAVRDVIAGL